MVLPVVSKSKTEFDFSPNFSNDTLGDLAVFSKLTSNAFPVLDNVMSELSKRTLTPFAKLKVVAKSSNSVCSVFFITFDLN